MARGGFRHGAGRPRGVKNRAGVAPAPTSPAETGKRRTPLEYMLDVMNDPMADQARRDRMAVAAAPFQHPRIGEGGKRDEKESAAKEAGAGKFAAAQPPRLVVNKP